MLQLLFLCHFDKFTNSHPSHQRNQPSLLLAVLNYGHAMGRVGDLLISSFPIKETAIHQSGMMQSSWFCSRDPILMIKKPSIMRIALEAPLLSWEWLLSVLFSPDPLLAQNPPLSTSLPSREHLLPTKSVLYELWGGQEIHVSNTTEVQNSQGYCFVHIQGIQISIAVPNFHNWWANLRDSVPQLGFLCSMCLAGWYLTCWFYFEKLSTHLQFPEV